MRPLVAAVYSLGAVIEVPLMILFPRLAGRVGAERLIVIGAFAFAIRALASAAATEPWQIVIASALGGFGYAFVYVGTVTWVAGSVSRSTQATAQGLFSGTTANIGSITGSLVGGRDRGGVRAADPVRVRRGRLRRSAGSSSGGRSSAAESGEARRRPTTPPARSAEEVEPGGHDRVGDRALAEQRPGAPDHRHGPAADLAEGQLGGRGDLVGRGPDRRLHHPAVGVGLAAEILDRDAAPTRRSRRP